MSNSLPAFGHMASGRGHSGESGASTTALSLGALSCEILFRVADAAGHNLSISASWIAATAVPFAGASTRALPSSSEVGTDVVLSYDIPSAAAMSATKSESTMKASSPFFPVS